MDNRPVGVFDSGVGGLTVLRALHTAMPFESTVYMGDLARCPYGPRPLHEVRRFAIQIADVLVAQGIKMLVVACNTATAAALSELTNRYEVPVIGVVGPGAQTAVALSRNRRIGVIATDGTVASGAYTEALRTLSPNVHVVERSASWLVPMVEQGRPARRAVAQHLAPTLAEMQQYGIDTLILGCTHFPIVRDIFEAGVDRSVVVVDSAETTAREAAALLASRGMLATGQPLHRLIVNGPAEAFRERACAMFDSSPAIETVDLSLDWVS